MANQMHIRLGESNGYDLEAHSILVFGIFRARDQSDPVAEGG
jgi:hypothetical protein